MLMIEKLPTRYFAGTASVQAGGTIVTPHDAVWASNAWGDDLFFLPSQPMVPPVRIEAVNEDGDLVLAYPWPGVDAVEAEYEIRYVGIIERSTAQSRRVLEQLGDVKSWADVFVATDADRLTLESPSNPLRAGFRVLVTEDGLIWAKASGAYGDWLPPAEFQGPQGNPGPYTSITFGPVTTVSPTTPASAVVVPTGPASIRIDLSIPKGLDGTGTGDFVGPNGGVIDGELVSFNGATGKAGKGTGLSPQASTLDTATNKLMRTGAFGLGATSVNLNAPNDNLNSLRTNGTYRCTALTVGTPFGSFIGQVTHAGQAGDYATQLAISAQNSAIYFRRLNNNVWSNWREVYHQDNILGFVSQTAGGPTGAIIERGSNANGDYARFADGTQICWQTITTNHPNGTLVSGAYVSDFVDTPMPATFVSVPVGGAFFLNTGFSFWMTGGPLNSSTWRTRALMLTAYTAGGVGSTFLFAIGRWF